MVASVGNLIDECEDMFEAMKGDKEQLDQMEQLDPAIVLGEIQKNSIMEMTRTKAKLEIEFSQWKSKFLGNSLSTGNIANGVTNGEPPATVPPSALPVEAHKPNIELQALWFSIPI